jgi:putative phage-type endonuclease
MRVTSLTPEQATARATGIGGSDCAAALGFSQWKSPLSLYLEKRGEIEPDAEETAALEWGVRLEPAVRQKYAEVTGKTVRLPTATLVHPDYPWMLCHPDGVTDDGRLYEGKTAFFADGWGEPGSADVPQPYFLQVQHNMLVVSAQIEHPVTIADVAVLIAGRDFRLYHVPADAEIQQMIVEGEAEFMDRVKLGNPPAPNYSSRDTKRLLAKLYPGTNGEKVVADEACETYLKAYEDAHARNKVYESLADCSKAALLFHMGEASELVFADGRVLRRKAIQKKSYTVDASSCMDARFVKGKE